MVSKKKKKSTEELVHKVDEFFYLRIELKDISDYEWSPFYLELKEAKQTKAMLDASSLVKSVTIVKKTVYEKLEEVKE